MFFNSFGDVDLNGQSVARRCLLGFRKTKQSALCDGLKVSMSHVILPILINYNLEAKFNEILKRKITILMAKSPLFCSFVAKLSQSSLLSYEEN